MPSTLPQEGTPFHQLTKTGIYTQNSQGRDGECNRDVSPTTNLDCLCDRPAKVALCACYPPRIHDGISGSVLPISALRRIETTSCAVDAEGHVNATAEWVGILILFRYPRKNAPSDVIFS